MEDKRKATEKELDEFLGLNNDAENKDNNVVIKSDKSIVEKIDKTIITEDGRQLLL